MNSKNEIIIITGSAPNTLKDMTACHDIIGDRPRLYMAIGLDAVDKYALPIRYMATFHPVEIPAIHNRRAAINGNLDYEIISHESREDVNHCIGDWWKPSGSSALLGVQAALRIGYNRIILCGCPLTGKNEQNGSYENFRNGWIPRVREIDGRVRSMSGWTKELLGAPTQEWLDGSAMCDGWVKEYWND